MLNARAFDRIDLFFVVQTAATQARSINLITMSFLCNAIVSMKTTPCNLIISNMSFHTFAHGTTTMGHTNLILFYHNDIKKGELVLVR